MKNPATIQIIILWGLFIFYGFIIISYFWKKTTEGLTDSLGNSTIDSNKTPTIASEIDTTVSTSPTINSGGNQDKIDNVNKQIRDLQKQLASLPGNSVPEVPSDSA
jgi:hypothetical protein